MKNALISFIIFFTMIIIMFFSLQYLNGVCSKFRAESNRLEDMIRAEDWDNAAAFSNDMLSRWKQQVTILPMFVNHAEIDLLTVEFLKLTQYVENRTRDESLASTHIVKFLLDNIKSLQKFNLENIF
jgi:hypothetical protein